MIISDSKDVVHKEGNVEDYVRNKITFGLEWRSASGVLSNRRYLLG